MTGSVMEKLARRLAGVRRGVTKGAVVFGLMVAMAGCSAQYRNHGYTPEPEDIAQLIVGVDTVDSVAETIGRPTASGLLAGGSWYYVGSRWRHFAWKAPRELEREVVAISFDDDGVVSNIEHFGLEDGRVVVLSRRVTDTNIKGVTFLRQLFGSFGNFTADQFLGN